MMGIGEATQGTVFYNKSARESAANTFTSLTADDLWGGRRAMNTVSPFTAARNRANAIDLTELLALHSAGATLSQLAKRYGVAVETVREKLKRIGAVPHPKGIPAEIRICADCGGEFKHFVSQDGGLRCKDCRGSNRWGKTRRIFETTCAECSAPVVRTLAYAKQNKNTFCNRECKAAWYSKHRTGPNHPQWTGGQAAKTARVEADPKTRLRRRISTLIRCSLKGRKDQSWSKLVGFTIDDLKRHLERQFAPGMTWENYGEWHIDHIVPVAAFDFERADDPGFRACFALTNLRPLWAFDNVSKGCKRTYLL